MARRRKSKAGEDSERPPRRSRPKRSRWARWVLRPLVWSPALLALLVVALLALLGSARFADWAARQAEDRLGAYLGRRVAIGSLEIELVPLSIEARDLVIAAEDEGDASARTESSTKTGRAPFAEVDRVQIDARVGSVLRPGLTLDRMFVDSPVIRVAFDESGRHDAPRRTPRRERKRRLDVAVGSVEVVGGTLEMEHRRFPLEVSARDVSATLGGIDSPYTVELAGQVRADDVTVLLPSARPYLGSVAIRGSYHPGEVTIAAATFEAPDVTADVNGVLSWRDDPGARFSVSAFGQGRLLDRLGYGQGLVRGPFEFSGEFERTPDDWRLTGDLSSPGVEVVDRRLAAVSGALEVDRDGARYRIGRARYGAGSLRGRVRMGLGSGEAPVELDLEMEKVEVDRLLLDQRIPVAGLAATATGTFSYQFARSEPRSGNGWADFRIDRLAGSAQDGLPVNGSAVLSFGDGVLRTEAVRLRGDNQLITATGFYDMPANRGRFDFEASTQSIDELLEVLPLPEPRAIWQPDRGSGVLSAGVVLDGESVVVTTEMDLDEVVAPGFAADRVQGRFVLDAKELADLRIEFLRPSAAVIVAGSVPLVDDEAGPGLSLAVDAEGWPLADFQPWLPFELPLTGPFSGGATLAGTLAAPTGSVRGRVARPALGGLTAESLEFDLDFSPAEVVFREARLGSGSGELRAIGNYDPSADRLALDVVSENLDLSAFETIAGAQPRLGGAVSVLATLGGGLARPELSMTLDVEGATFDGAAVGRAGIGTLSLDWDGREIEADGEFDGLLSVRGGGLLEGGAADLGFEFSSSDLRSIGNLFTAEALPRFDAAGSGVLTIEGAFDSDRLPDARLRFDEFLVLHETGGAVRTLEQLEPITLAFDREGIELVSLYLGSPGGESEIFVAGDVGLDASKGLDLNLQSTLAASWFEPWVPSGVTLAEGSFEIIGSIGGSLEAPRMDGAGQFSRGKVLTPALPATFESIEAVLLFFPGQVVLDELTSRVAGGRLTAAGAINLKADGLFDYRFQLAGDGISFRYPEGWSVRGDADLTLASIEGGRQLTGGLDLDRALYVTDVPIELDQLLRSYFEQRRLEVAETDEILATTQLNLAIAAKETLRIRNNLANLRGSADLVLRGSLARPVVFGSVEFDPSGRVTYSGNEYEIERGVLTFANPYRLEPVVDLVARTALREYDVTLSLSGTPERLNFDFISDPPLAELEVMALMTGGRPLDSSFSETPDSQDLQNENLGAERFLYGQATSLVANRFNRLFGLDQFRIVPLTSATGDLSSARVTVGKQLSRDLLATYSYDPSETGEQVLELEWSVSRSLVLVITQNGDGTYAVDAKYQKAF